MSTIPALTSRRLVEILKRAGFVELRQKGSHRILFRDLDRCRITVPMHSRSLGKGLAHAIIKQAGLTPDEIMKLIKRD